MKKSNNNAKKGKQAKASSVAGAFSEIIPIVETVTDSSALLGRPLGYVACVAHRATDGPDDRIIGAVGLKTSKGPRWAALLALVSTVRGLNDEHLLFEYLMDDGSEDPAALRDTEVLHLVVIFEDGDFAFVAQSLYASRLVDL